MQSFHGVCDSCLVYQVHDDSNSSRERSDEERVTRYDGKFFIQMATLRLVGLSSGQCLGLG